MKTIFAVILGLTLVTASAVAEEPNPRIVIADSGLFVEVTPGKPSQALRITGCTITIDRSGHLTADGCRIDGTGN
jgi:hypothetical protein